ncbi:MAG: cytochrome d ubiquinol oxidase subunit II, partial [Pseudomonadota bacterium]
VWGLILGIGAISLTSPFVSDRIFDKWFAGTSLIYLAPLPIISGMLIVYIWSALRRLTKNPDKEIWGPFTAAMALFALSFLGMAYSFYPYVVPNQMTIYESASAPEALIIILVGTLFVLPTILAYTALSYYLFRGKATELRYD